MNKIKNFESLSVTPARRHLLSIAEAGLQAVDTQDFFKKNLSLIGNTLSVDGKTFKLPGDGRVIIVAVGKSSTQAGIALEKILGSQLSAGIILDTDIQEDPAILTPYRGTHPFPSDANRKATKEIITLLQSLSEKDFVIFVISGGGSVLLSQSDAPISQEVGIIKELFKKGATIQELNTVRKHLSLARGGFLAQYAHPARSLTLILSDVPGNDISFIASGPTVKDATTIRDAQEVLNKYEIAEMFSTLSFIETPKEEKYFKNIANILFLSNTIALKAMEEKARELRLFPRIITDALSGEASEVGKHIAQAIKGLPPGSVLLYGGETTVTFADVKGAGGRNQELALSALVHLDSASALLSLASDGQDNNLHAGALADLSSLKKAQELGLYPETYLTSHDSFPFWEKTHDFISTGATGSNISDLVIAIKS
ncbi:MAG: DUF4147 domain-containing protein [Patescibacteria group bacterium]